MPTCAVGCNNRALREAISQITTGLSLADQPARIEALRREYPHSIALVERAEEPSYNCVQYAFNLIDLPHNIRTAINQLKNWRTQRRLVLIDPLGSWFVSFLIQQGVLCPLNEAGGRNLVVYWNKQTAGSYGSVIRHVGKIVQGERVISK